MRVLIVDDSLTMRKMLSAILEGYSITSIHAENGADGIEKLQKEGPFNAVLVDWDMPIMDGIEFVKQTRKNKAYSKMKIIMVTSHNTMDDVLAAMAEGADDYIMKPIEENSVIERLQMLQLID